MRRISTCLLTVCLSLTACGQTTSPNTVIRTWADAAQAGDYATAEALMAGDDFAKLTWREPHQRYRDAGRLQEYTIIEGPTTSGASTTATLRWTGTMAPICITVQVDGTGKLTPRSDYERCEVSP